MADQHRASHLLQQIDKAFCGVTLGDGVSLHETEVIDCYGTDEERLRARAGDEKDDWHKLIDDPELVKVCGVGGLCFYDAAGLRFHLPAYLSHVVANAEDEGDICQRVLFQLTSIGDERLLGL